MTEKKFISEMNRARIMRDLETARAEYWNGYQRGLRRAYHGEDFGTSEEHCLWLDAINSEDESRRQRGEGYRDGMLFAANAETSLRDHLSKAGKARAGKPAAVAASRENAKKGGWPKGKPRKQKNLLDKKSF